MGYHPFISVIVPTHNMKWELHKTLFSLSRQIGIESREFEILIMNTNPNDIDSLRMIENASLEMGNIRLINIHDSKTHTITNATYPLNVGVRQYAKGPVLLLSVDSARVPTPGVVRKTRDEFDRWGDDIVTTTIPYHFLKHYSDPTITREEVRDAFLNSRWNHDLYSMFHHAAHTNISRSGKPNESTWLGVTRKNFLEVGGHNEIFTTWSDYNLDLWRRLTRSPPKNGIQIPKQDYHWGKVGLGLEVHILEGEGDFHLHHSLSDAQRSFKRLKELRIESWDEYEEIGNCITANLTRPDWGTSDRAEEVNLQKTRYY
jgi:hypothetical protein